MDDIGATPPGVFITQRAVGVTDRVLVKLLLRAVAIVSGFFGVVNLASIFSRYGYRWHSDVVAVVQAYKDTIYPIYEFLFGWIFRLFHISLGAPIKDSLTIVGLAFIAANAESAIRDGRPLVANAFRATRAFSGSKDEPGMFARLLPILGQRKVAIPALIVVLVGIGLMMRGIFQFVEARFGSFGIPHWYWRLVVVSSAINLIYGIVLVVASAIYPGLLAQSDGNAGRDRFFGFAVVALVLALPLVPLSLTLVALFATFCAIYLAVIFCLIVASAPFVAWRTVFATIALFGLLIAANWAVLNRVI